MKEVRQVAENFVATWNARAKIPVLQLDYTWPSTGVLDHLTFELRAKFSLNDSDRSLLRGVSCYLCVIAEQCWKEGGAEVSGTISTNGVLLRAAGGIYLGDDEYVLDVESELRDFLQRSSGKVSLFPDSQRTLTFGENYLSPFALAVVSGRYPRGIGPWAVLHENVAKPRLEAIVRILGQSCVRWYERLFPDELLGQIGELYLQRLIFPPPFLADKDPMVDVVDSVAAFLRSSGLTYPQLVPAAQNLCQSADELIGGFGFICACGLLDRKDLPQSVRAAALAKSPASGLLRPAVVRLREIVAGQNFRDYLTQDKHKPEDLEAMRFDLSCGLIPWIQMRPEILEKRNEQPMLSPLLQTLSRFDVWGAVQVADAIIEETPALTEVRLQRLYLDILIGDMDRADHFIRVLLTEPGMETSFKLYSLWATVRSLQGDDEGAAKCYQQALDLVPSDHPAHADLANDYGWMLFLADRFEEALGLFDRAVERSEFPVTPLLNKTHVLRALGREEESRAALARSLKLSPLDRRVFGSVYFA